MTEKEALGILGCKNEGGNYYDQTGLYHDSLETLIHCGLFDFCGCGMPDYVLNGFRETLKGQKEEKLADNKMQIYLYILNKEEYLEHGSSIFGSWLTEKGKALLFLLDVWYEDEFPDEEKS